MKIRILMAIIIILSFLMCSCNSSENVITDNANNTKSFLKEDDEIVLKYSSFEDLINSTYTLGSEVESNDFDNFKKNVLSSNYTEYSFVLNEETNEACFTEILRFGSDYKVKHGVLLLDGNKLSETEPSPVSTQVYVDGQLYQQNADSDYFKSIESNEEISFLGYSILSDLDEYEALESYYLKIEENTYIATHTKSRNDDTEEKYFVFDKNSNLIGVVIDLNSTNKIGEFISIEYGNVTGISAPDVT